MQAGFSVWLVFSGVPLAMPKRIRQNPPWKKSSPAGPPPQGLLQPPVRVSLVEQVVLTLEQMIRGGKCGEFLPPEAELGSQLQVSRVTLRKALTELSSRGWVAFGGRGGRNRIVRKGGALSGGGSPVVVRCLSPFPGLELVHSTRIILSVMGQNLEPAGVSVAFEHRKALWQGNPEKRLARLTAEAGAACWVLFRASPAMQAWFQNRQLPCLVLGPCHPGIDLPSVESDAFALGRHAASEIGRHDHRHVAYALIDPDVASTRLTLAGLREGMHPRGRLERLSILQYDDTTDGLRKKIRKLMAEEEPPTCFFVSEAAQAWPVIGLLSELCLRVPEDVSLVVRDHETFLSYSVPEVTRYSFDPERFGRIAAMMLRSIIAGAGLKTTHRRLLPDFIQGKTLSVRRSK